MFNHLLLGYGFLLFVCFENEETQTLEKSSLGNEHCFHRKKNRGHTNPW